MKNQIFNRIITNYHGLFFNFLFEFYLFLEIYFFEFFEKKLNRGQKLQVCDARNAQQNYLSW